MKVCVVKDVKCCLLWRKDALVLITMHNSTNLHTDALFLNVLQCDLEPNMMLRERLGTIMKLQRYDGTCFRSRISGKSLWVIFSETNVFTNRETTQQLGDIIDIMLFRLTIK